MLHIRPFRPGDEPALFRIYHSAVHRIACRDDTQEQVEAWAPADLDAALWATRMQGISPFVTRRGLAELTVDVSRTAQPFFARHGFVVVEQRLPVRRGVVLPNALMRKVLASSPA